MRIISGVHKGRRINTPKNLPVRPTKDMAKEALFNILNNHFYFDEISVLDLFSGTGSISYEFASRGCENITAIDSHVENTKFIKEMADALAMPINVLTSDVYSYLENSKYSFSVIFADPPYDMSIEDFSQLPYLIFQNALLEKDGMLIIEHSKKMDLSHLEFFHNSRNYGGSVFSFFQFEDSGEEE